MRLLLPGRACEGGIFERSILSSVLSPVAGGGVKGIKSWEAASRSRRTSSIWETDSRSRKDLERRAWRTLFLGCCVKWILLKNKWVDECEWFAHLPHDLNIGSAGTVVGRNRVYDTDDVALDHAHVLPVAFFVRHVEEVFNKVHYVGSGVHVVLFIPTSQSSFSLLLFRS